MKERIKMSEPQCSHNCESCSANCASREGGTPQSFLEKPNKLSSIKKVIGVVSGKGGVGKSLVTSLMAVTMTRKGYTSAILDADITGPSIPKIFGVTGPAAGNEMGILPVSSKGGIDIMSVNLLLENDADPVVVRGPIIAGTVKQFWTDVIWTDVDFMFVDMPPGTGDVPLTVFQSIPVDGIIVVTSPQDLVSMIVAKAVKMAEMMNVPIIGLVENYSYFKCPDCGKEYHIFGESHIDEIASKHDLSVLAKLPIDPKAARACDEGRIEEYQTDLMDHVCDRVVSFCSK
jgi:Mrp family chromosome partitioning ATPase